MTSRADDDALAEAIARRLREAVDKGHPTHRALARGWDRWRTLAPAKRDAILADVRHHADVEDCALCHFSMVLLPDNPLAVPGAARVQLLEAGEVLADLREEILAWNVVDFGVLQRRRDRSAPAGDPDIMSLSWVEGSDVLCALFHTERDAEEGVVVDALAARLAGAPWPWRALSPERARRLVETAGDPARGGEPVMPPGAVVIVRGRAWVIQLAERGGTPGERAGRLFAAVLGLVEGSAARDLEAGHGVSIARTADPDE